MPLTIFEKEHVNATATYYLRTVGVVSPAETPMTVFPRTLKPGEEVVVVASYEHMIDPLAQFPRTIRSISAHHLAPVEVGGCIDGQQIFPEAEPVVTGADNQAGFIIIATK